jgi:hypothetical protein
MASLHHDPEPRPWPPAAGLLLAAAVGLLVYALVALAIWATVAYATDDPAAVACDQAIAAGFYTEDLRGQCADDFHDSLQEGTP